MAIVAVGEGFQYFDLSLGNLALYLRIPGGAFDEQVIEVLHAMFEYVGDVMSGRGESSARVEAQSLIVVINASGRGEVLFHPGACFEIVSTFG